MTVRAVQVTPSLLHIDSILSHLSGPAALAEVCRFLRAEFAHYEWVGIYRLEGLTLVLDAWDGDRATEHTRIPVERGLCGKAIRDDRTVIVEDVRKSMEYLACFLETRSEIVVPIRRGGRPVGEIDIDGTKIGAYDATDGAFLERVATKLSACFADPPPPGPDPSDPE